uniref:Endo/exonuclease/phosphatase domain-containing protein n=1 Tax=Angiostrongylus cantonensis TaxID=6313 RepID=A0A0K0D7I3_ANGCA
MEVVWIKNYGDDLYLQCTYTCIRVLDRGLAQASKNDKVRRHRPGRDDTRVPDRRLAHASKNDKAVSAFSSTRVRYDAIGMAETTRRHPFNAVYDTGEELFGLTETTRRHPFNAVYDTGEELFLGTCDSRGVGGVGVLVNTSLSMNIDSFEQLTTRIRRLRLKRCGSTPVSTIFVVYAPTSNYDKGEVEAFYMDLERFYREDHTFFKVIIGDFNAKIGPRTSSEERHIGTHGIKWNEQGERLFEFIMATKTIHGNSQFQKPHRQRWTWESPNGECHSEIDHIIVNTKFCLINVAIVPKFYTGSDYRLLRARFYFSRKREKARHES